MQIKISEKGKMILADEQYFIKYNLSSVTYIGQKTQKTNNFIDLIKKEDNENDDSELDVNIKYY